MKIDRPIAVAIIFFIILLLVFFLVVPEYKIFGQLQTQLAEKKAEYNAEYDYYNAIAKTHNDLQAHTDDIKKIDDALPQDSSLGKTIYFLQQTAKENGIVIKNLSLSKSSPKSSATGSSQGVNDIVFSADLLGDYPSFDRFIIASEKSSRIFEITDISFGSPAGPIFGADQSQFQMQQTFSFKVQIKTHSY
jgi:Tfp pilus assembly protein PilO